MPLWWYGVEVPPLTGATKPEPFEGGGGFGRGRGRGGRGTLGGDLGALPAGGRGPRGRGLVSGAVGGGARVGRGLVGRRSLGRGFLGGDLRGLLGGGPAVAAEGQPQARVDEGGVRSDGLAVVGVQLLPTAVEVALGGDLREVVARHDGVDGRGGGSGGRGGRLEGPGNLRGRRGLYGRRGRGGGVRTGGTHQRQREGRAAGTGHGETAGYRTGLRAAVLTLCGHGGFLSVACEVSCRVRTGDLRPHPWDTRTTSPRAVRKRSGTAAYLVPPLLPRASMVGCGSRAAAGLGGPPGSIAKVIERGRTQQAMNSLTESQV